MTERWRHAHCRHPWAMHVCRTHKNVRSVKRVSAAEKCASSKWVCAHLSYLRAPCAHVLTTLCPSTDMCLADLFILIFSSGTLWFLRRTHSSCLYDEILFQHPWAWIPSSFVFLQYVCWCNKLVPFVIVFGLQERKCDRFGWTFDLDLVNWHIYRGDDFPQHVLHFLFCRVVVESCYNGSFLVLAFLWFVSIRVVRPRSASSAVWVFQPGHPFLHGGDLLIHSDVFIGVFFLHFVNCRVRSS